MAGSEGVGLPMDLPIDYVETLARALDHDDYSTAASVMGRGVRYEVGDEVFVGPEAVVASYRASSEMARRLFDEVSYQHEVIPTDDPHAFRVSYTDLLTAGDETLTHFAEQRLTVAPSHGVVRIVDVNLRGEKEKVDRFLARHGLARD